MKAYWVIDILKDIRQFSEKNGMVELAEQLDDAIFVAASEIGAEARGAGYGRGWHRQGSRRCWSDCRPRSPLRSFRSGRTSCATPRRHPRHLPYRDAEAASRSAPSPTASNGSRRYIEQGLPQHRPGGARGAAALPPDGLEDARLVERRRRAQMMREAMAHGPRQPGLVGADLGAAGRVRAVRASTTTPTTTAWAALHREHGQGHPAGLAPDAPAGDADHQQRDGAADRRAVAARARGADAAQPRPEPGARWPTRCRSRRTRCAPTSTRARHKLGALNVTHAVALALARGIIVPKGALPKY